MSIGYLNNYAPHRGQKEFHEACNDTKNKTVIVVSSIRSGKTLSLIYQILKDSWNAPMPSDTGNLVCGPYWNQLGEVLEQQIVNLAAQCGLLKDHNYSKHRTILKNGNKIYFKSLDNFDAIRGLNVWNAYVDEGAMVEREAIDVVRGRLLTHNGRLVIASTPKGFNNFLYEDYFAPDTTRIFKAIKYKLRDNPLITEEAIQELYRNYDEKMALQELEGEFVNINESAVYYSFSDNNILQPHQHVQKDSAYSIHIGADYNLGINAWIACQYINNNIYVFDEGYGAKTTTDMGKEILAKYHPANFMVIDDSSGNARQQADGITNRQLLRQLGVKYISSSTSNPRRDARFANTNAWLKNSLGEHRIFINSNCKKLIGELRELSYKKNSKDVDDRSGSMGHISDAFSYAVYYLSGGNVPSKTTNKILR